MQFVYRLLQKVCCMKLKDAIRYYELTGCDVFDDFKKQNQYIRYLSYDFDLPNDFTEVIEKLSDNLLILWADSHSIDGYLPTNEELVNMYLSGIPKPENSKEDKTIEQLEVIEAPSRFRKSKSDNKTLDLIISIVNSEMDLQQFYELETELVIDIMNEVAARREKEAKKRKRKGR